jgi:hypothetical protein
LKTLLLKQSVYGATTDFDRHKVWLLGLELG